MYGARNEAYEALKTNSLFKPLPSFVPTFGGGALMSPYSTPVSEEEEQLAELLNIGG